MKLDPIRKQEIDESMEKGSVFTILDAEEAMYAVDKVASLIGEKDILSSFLPRIRKDGMRDAKSELLKLFRRQLRSGKVYPRTSRDNIIAFIGGYIVAMSRQ